MINVETKSIGTIQAIIRDKNLKIKETINFNNNLLRNGREALASSLANQIGNSYDFFISKMVFGDGGTSEGIPKFVSSDRIGL